VAHTRPFAQSGNLCGLKLLDSLKKEIEKHKLLVALGTVCLFAFASPALSQDTSTTTPAATTDTAAQARDDDDDGFDMGWLGLLGLIGLVGLRGRHVDRTATVWH
jgi:hypothetical protein